MHYASGRTPLPMAARSEEAAHQAGDGVPKEVALRGRLQEGVVGLSVFPQRVFSCTLRGLCMSHPIPALRKRGLRKSMALKYYWLRIACFVCTMYFTFAGSVWPLALMGWLVLGAFFWQDFFPSRWPWEF